jgi:hypothetical protein
LSEKYSTTEEQEDAGERARDERRYEPLLTIPDAENDPNGKRHRGHGTERADIHDGSVEYGDHARGDDDGSDDREQAGSDTCREETDASGSFRR